RATIALRSCGSIAVQAGCASRAARYAASTSSALADRTENSVRPVYGSTSSSVFSPLPSRHSPPMNCRSIRSYGAGAEAVSPEIVGVVLVVRALYPAAARRAAEPRIERGGRAGTAGPRRVAGRASGPENASAMRITRHAISMTFGALLAGGLAAGAASAAEPDVAAPAGAMLVREVQAGGAQVYACRQAADGSYGWSLVGPNAVLVNADGTTFGTHTAGPTWTASDGSSVVADGAHPVNVVRRPNAVPALLLSVASSNGNGVLTGVRFIRRSDTEGGVAPATGCDAGAARANARAAVHYSAIYSF